MDHYYIYLLFFISLFILMAIYFKIADKYNIIDKPNSRSSHTTITVRGGGIIFPIAVVIFSMLFRFNHPLFMLGLVMISILSFVDDIKTLSSKIRMPFQFIAILFLFLDTGLFQFPFYWLIPSIIFAVATVNAMNFMDGINGVTGAYSLLTIFTLVYVNEEVTVFQNTSFMIAIGLALIVFLFFNFRRKAKCFAGDVGSVSIAFILIFLITCLILTTKNISYICLLLLYGLDTISTVFFRIIRKENILEAHRSHFYQFLANEKGWSHIAVSTLYMCVQLLINFAILFVIKNSFSILILAVSLSTLLFFAIRFWMEGSNQLLKKRSF